MQSRSIEPGGAYGQAPPGRYFNQNSIRSLAILDHSSELLCVRDVRGEVLYECPSRLHILGYEPGEATPRGFDAVHPDDRADVLKVFQEVLKEPGASIHHKLRMLRKDGSCLHVEGCLTNLLHVEGIRGVITNGRDITERVMAEHALKLKSNNLEALINATPDLMWGIDRDMIVTTANNPFLGMVKAMFGIEFAIGMRALRTVDHDPVVYARWEQHYARALAGERFTVYEEGTEPVYYRSCITLNPIMDGNTVVGAACFSQDVAAQTIAERELRRNEAHLMASQRIAGVGSWELDIASTDEMHLNGHRWSGEAYRIFGLEPGVPVNTDLFFSMVHPDDRSGVQAAFAHALGSSNTYSKDHRIVLPNGEVRVIHGHADIVRDHVTCRPLKVTGTVHDITERKRAEEEIRALNVDLEQRVMDRTSELELVNEQLEAEAFTKEKLANELQFQKEEQTASLCYARGIQEALLPGAAEFDLFRDHAIMDRPLHLVGGDMYWAHATDRLLYVAVGDCTGHGVPGAMLTMIGHDILNSLVLEEGLVQPDLMLAQIDRRFEQLFRTNEDGANSIHDGMDMALCIIDRETLELSFAGATLSAIVLRDGALVQLAGTKVNLGGVRTPGRKNFSTATMQLMKGDRLILGTDGFADQFGGPRNKKLMRSGYLEMLRSCAHMKATDAVRHLRERFDQWIGDNDQVDDVLVMVLDV